MTNKKVLFVGESWETFSIHIKGFDTFVTSKYEEGGKWLKEALEKGGYEVEFMPNHHAPGKFPVEADEIEKYSAIILSDIGSNTLLLHPDTFERSIPTPNRLKLIRDYVLNGGAFLMIGGYMSFQGIDGKAKYANTPIEEILPVKMMTTDDRIEVPEGFKPEVVDQHPIVEGLEKTWPMLLGYNKTYPKEDARVLVAKDKDPILIIKEAGMGRTAAFTSDCAPHWGSPEFVQWENYSRFWCQLMEWLIV